MDPKKGPFFAIAIIGDAVSAPTAISSTETSKEAFDDANGTEKDIASAIIEDVSKCPDKAATGQDETGRKEEWMKFLYSVAKAKVLFS